jgi:hypothetical protein
MLIRILDSIEVKQPSGVLSVVDELASRGQDLRNFCRDLLGLFRDLLVTKVGGDPGLLESSVVEPDELTRRSAGFSESDLVRFFHSLAETETRLKTAAQPRYLLEVGLVRLVEMRRLTSLESILERLDAIALGLNGSEPLLKAASAPESKPADSPLEKKTLKSEVPPPPVRDESRNSAVDARPDLNATALDLEAIRSMPGRLPMIPSEELAHAEDPWLDDAYERKLVWSGDDLSPIEGANGWISDISGQIRVGEASHATVSNAASAVAAATALAASDPDPTSSAIELPRLAETPSKDELLAYAHSHPAVRTVLKVFRGKIQSVELIKTQH